MFDALPDEVIVRIFKELQVYDILNCSLTCRLFHGTIRDSVILQYQMELDVSGVEDGDAECRLSVARKLAELKTIEQGWDKLHFRHKHRARLPSSNIWELFGGVLAHGIMTPVTRGLSFIQLPSVVRGTSLHTWQQDMGIEIRDFAMDPAQDLAVLIAHPVIIVSTHVERSCKFQIHLRTMSGGGCHPSALDSVLSCVTNHDVPEYDFVIQVMGDFLALLFRTPFGSWADELFIWDWKRAQLLTRLKLPHLARTKINSVSFLSPRHFIIARSCTDPAHYGQDPPALEVYDFLAPRPEGSTDPRLVRRYELPHLSRQTSTLSIITRSDPSPDTSFQSTSSHARPFYTASTSRLLTVSMQFHCLTLFVSCMLFVHHSALLEDLEPDSMLGDVIVPWEEWGYTKTRVMPQLHSENIWVCYVHGTRYVQLEESDREGLYHIRMLDFNSLALRRASKNSSSGDTGPFSDGEDTEPLRSTIVLESQPTVIDVYKSAFSQRVVTTLPYRDVVSRKTFPYDAVMIDEDCVLGRRVRTHWREVEVQCI